MQFFPLIIPNPNVNSLKKENESLKSEIAARKKNFEFRTESTGDITGRDFEHPPILWQVLR